MHVEVTPSYEGTVWRYSRTSAALVGNMGKQEAIATTSKSFTHPPRQHSNNVLVLSQAAPLDENDLTPEQLEKDLDEEIRVFEAKTRRLNEERILSGLPPPPPPPPATAKSRHGHKVVWDTGKDVTLNEDTSGAHEDSTTKQEEHTPEVGKIPATINTTTSTQELPLQTNFEELD